MRTQCLIVLEPALMCQRGGASLQALHNIFYAYAVVGHLENLQATWQVMERRMPSWFKGGSKHSGAPAMNRHVPAGHSR